MPMGKGTYGSKVGRPPKKKKMTWRNGTWQKENDGWRNDEKENDVWWYGI